MSVTLADDRNVEASEMCVMPSLFCSDIGHAVMCMVEYHALQCLNRNVVQGHDWLHYCDSLYGFWGSCSS